MLVLSKFNAIAMCVLVTLSAYLVGCGSQQSEEAHQLQQPLTYAGPPLSMPLPAGMLWKVNTNPGFSSPAVTYHSGVYYHAIDFGDNFYVGGIFYDEGDGVIDVLASADGRVSEVVEKPNCSNGLSGRACKVFLNHSEARRGVGYETEYTHLSPGTIVVSVGQNVKRGQKIGKLGWTGTGKPHLHFSLRYNNDGSKNNPALASAKLENVPFINYALDQRYPSTNGFTFNSASNPTLCSEAPTGSAATNWVYTCTPKSGSVKVKEAVFGLIGIEKIAHNFGWKAEVVNPKGTVIQTYQWDATGVDPWGWDRSYYWPWVYPGTPGKWELRYFVKTNDSFPTYPMAVLPFTVADTPPYIYNGNGLTCSDKPTGSATTNWVYTCTRPTSTFSSAFNPTVYGLLYVENIFKNFKFVTKVFNNGQYLFTHDPLTFTIVEPWVWRYAYAFPEIQRPLPGTWRMEVYLVYDDGTPGVHLKDLSFTVTL